MQAEKSGSLYTQSVAIGLILLCCVFCWNVGVVNDIDSVDTLFTLLFAVQLVPVCVWMIRRSPDYLSFIFIIYLLTFTWPNYQRFLRTGVLASESRHELVEMILCNFITLCAYYMVRYFTIDDRQATERLRMVQHAPYQIGLLIAALVGSTLTETYGPLELARMAGSVRIACYIFILCAECPTSPRLVLIAKLCVVAAAGLTSVSGGMLGTSIVVVLAAIPMLIITKKYKLLLLFVPFFIVGVAFQSVKSVYRQFTWSAEREYSISEKIELTGELFKALLFPESALSSEVSSAMDGARLLYMYNRGTEKGLSAEELAEIDPSELTSWDMILLASNRVVDDSLASVLKMTPHDVPYWNGETYLNALYTLIPRPIWKEKPSFDSGPKFGHAYGYLNDDDEDTSISYSYLAEGYMNFGYAGLYGAAVFIGLLLACFETFAIRFKFGCNLPLYLILILPGLTYQVAAVTILQSAIMDGIMGLAFCIGIGPKGAELLGAKPSSS